jgi:hypothetical protein
MVTEFVIYDGKLVGNGLQFNCKVRVEERRYHDLQGNPWTPIPVKREILSIDGDPPDGHYRLLVNGGPFEFRFEDGEGKQIN